MKCSSRTAFLPGWREVRNNQVLLMVFVHCWMLPNDFSGPSSALVPEMEDDVQAQGEVHMGWMEAHQQQLCCGKVCARMGSG